MKNLDELLDMMEKGNPKEDLVEFARKSADNAIAPLHLTAGMRLRNELSLWEKNELTKWFNSIGIYHADDMSGIIYTSLHRKLNGLPIDLEGQVKFYQDFWKMRGFKDGIPK